MKIERLRRCGMVNEGLFRRFAADRPHRLAEIRAVEALHLEPG